MAGITQQERICKGEAEYLFDMTSSPAGSFIVKIQSDTDVLVNQVIMLK
jgi:hypothetical protein